MRSLAGCWNLVYPRNSNPFIITSASLNIDKLFLFKKIMLSWQ